MPRTHEFQVTTQLQSPETGFRACCCRIRFPRTSIADVSYGVRIFLCVLVCVAHIWGVLFNIFFRFSISFVLWWTKRPTLLFFCCWISIPVKFNRGSLYSPEIAPLKHFEHTASKMFLNPPRETLRLWAIFSGDLKTNVILVVTRPASSLSLCVCVCGLELVWLLGIFAWLWVQASWHRASILLGESTQNIQSPDGNDLAKLKTDKG